MATDLNIQLLTTTTNLLFEKINTTNNVITLTNVKILNSHVIGQNELAEMAKNAKTKPDLLNYFQKYEIKDASTKVDLIDKQNQLYFSFLKDYPEFSKLQKSEIEKLLSKIITNARIKTNPLTILSYYGTKGTIMLADITQQWAKAVDRCEVYYGIALVTIWIDVAISAGFTAGFAAAPAIATAMVLTATAYIAKELCIDWATEDYLSLVE